MVFFGWWLKISRLKIHKREPFVRTCVNRKNLTIEGMSLIPFIAERLRALRHRHAITQQECAELSGLSFKFYQRLEAGRKKQVWLETIEKVADVFGLQVCEFLDPDLPVETRISKKIIESNIHYRRKRKGPYYRASEQKPTPPAA